MTTERYTDESLQRDIDAGGTGVRMHSRQAAILITVPAEVRESLWWEAGTMQNYIGGPLSGCLYSAVATWKHSGTYPYGERARAHCLAERELNERLRAVNPAADRVILPMN